jgi:DNA transposition AAA+ family ATPase
MRNPPSVPVIFTARVMFHGNDDRASLVECDQREHLRFLIHRLKILRAAMRRVERLRRIAADARPACEH